VNANGVIGDGRVSRPDAARTEGRLGDGHPNGNGAHGTILDGDTGGLVRKLSRDQFDDDDEDVDGGGAQDAEGANEDGWRVIVVDVSALMWASKCVRALVGNGWEVVIPSEGESGLCFHMHGHECDPD
jgi:hypothetical protein